jgi:ketosteroid isomerase-like protein
MTRTTVDNVKTVEALYEAFARGDIATVIGAMDENIEWCEAEGNPWHPGHAFVGPQQVVDGVFTRIGQEFEDFRVVVHRFIGCGDTVVVEAQYHAASHRATGKPLDAQVAHVWDLQNGKLVHWQQYVDTRQLADVMGVSAV